MLLIPAIDIKDGKCVRLRQGRFDEVTVYADDVVAVADRWVASGARRIHVVDLDGAQQGRPKNADVIRRIAEGHPDVPLQVGGGIRDEEAIEAYLNAGVHYVIIGTKAVTMPHFVADVCTEFPGRILVGLDARDGKVAVDGWSKLSSRDAIEVAQQFEQDGVDAIIYTDIARDGMLTGVNVEATVRLAQAVNIDVIASGGVANLDDIEALAACQEEGIIGAIAGRALYEGALDFAQGQRVADNPDVRGD
jgi:phosphoribosylformimino-5-aminoimidazole carboxamide ribotide isomerase